MHGQRKTWFWNLRMYFCIIIAAVCLAGCAKSVEDQIAEQLQLGQKYLTEAKYEEAVAVFSKVLELDEKQVDAYLGRGQAYEAMAIQGEPSEEEYLKKAVADYEKAYELNGGNQTAYGRLTTLYIRIGDLERLQGILNAWQGDEDDGSYRKAGELLYQIAELCRSGDTSAVFDLFQTQAFDEMQKFFEISDRIIFSLEDRTGIGVYHVQTRDYGSCMVYYGDYDAENEREGHGIWIGFLDGNNYCAEGTWSKDSPNGQQKVQEWNGHLNESVRKRIISGNVSNGFWNGNVIWAFDDVDDYRAFPVSFTNGKWVVLKVDDEEGEVEYIVSETGHTAEADGTATMTTKTPEELEGIEGFIQ